VSHVAMNQASSGRGTRLGRERVLKRMIGAALLFSVSACGVHREVASGANGRAASPVAPTQLSAEQLRSDAALAPRIAALLAAPGNFSPALSPDGKTVLFLSDRSGNADLYLADVAHPEATPKKLVSAAERIVSPIFSGDGRAVFFRQDRGADENYRIFRVSVDGGAPVNLTPDVERWRDVPLLPRDRQGEMLYSARTPANYTSFLFVHELASGKETTVYRDEQGATGLDVSPDGRRVLWLRLARDDGDELFEIDVATRAARRLWPLNGKPARISAAAYSADGATAFIATDAGIEGHFLIALDPRALTKRAEYRQEDPGTAEIGAIVPSPIGDRLAVLIDAGNHTTVRLLDAHSLTRTADVSAPLGSVELGIDTSVLFQLNASTF